MTDKTHVPRHYAGTENLRDQKGRLWLPLGFGDHYIRQGQRGEPALTFRVLAKQHGPMIKEHHGSAT